MSKYFSGFLFSLLAMFVTGSCKERLTGNEKIIADAKATVEESYKALLNGKYEVFLNNRAESENLPDDYREQLLTSYKQFVANQVKEHGGITSFDISDANIDSIQNLVHVFVVLNYADSIQEEIVVPLIENKGTWKMK